MIPIFRASDVERAVSPHEAYDDALVTAQLFLVLVSKVPDLAAPGIRDLSLIVAAGLVLITVIVFISPQARSGLGLLLLRLRAFMGI